MKPSISKISNFEILVTYNGKSTRVKKSKNKLSWRLVHDGKKVLNFFKSQGITQTINTLFEASTEKKCLDEIDRLNLEYSEEVINELT
jgi:hypothetical protein